MIDTGKKVSLDINGNYILYNADCIDVLAELDPESVDLVVTSPPYDTLRTYEGTCRWDFDVFKTVADRLCRVLKKGAVIVWIVSDATVNGSETGSSFRQALYFKDIGLNIHDTMIWRKQTSTDTGSLRVRYGNVFEYMFVFSKGKPKTFNPLMDRANKGAGRKKSGPVVQADGSRTPISSKGKAYRTMGQRFNVWDVNTVVSKEERTGHPAQFPLSLARDHILSWSNEGDTVLDPFMGSGTTGAAATGAGRKFIGIEKVERYFRIASERIRSASLISDIAKALDIE